MLIFVRDFHLNCCKRSLTTQKKKKLHLVFCRDVVGSLSYVGCSWHLTPGHVPASDNTTQYTTPLQTAPGRGHFFLTTWPWQKITVSFGTLRHHSGNILLWVESFWIFRFWHVWALLFTPQLLLIKLHSLLHMSVLTKLHQQQLLLASWCSSFLKLIKISILDTWDQF